MPVSPAILTLAQSAIAPESGPTWQWVVGVLLTIVGSLLTLILGWGAVYLRTLTRKVEEGDKKTQAGITGIKESITVLSTRMGAIEQRLHDGDARFDRLDQRHREIETRHVQELTEIKTRLATIERNQERAKSA